MHSSFSPHLSFFRIGIFFKKSPIFVTSVLPFSFISKFIFFQFVSDWEIPSKTKWSILMEDIFGDETPSGVTMVRFLGG